MYLYSSNNVQNCRDQLFFLCHFQLFMNVFFLLSIDICNFYESVIKSVKVLTTKLDRGSIGTSPMHGIGSPPKKYKDTSYSLIFSSVRSFCT